MKKINKKIKLIFFFKSRKKLMNERKNIYIEKKPKKSMKEKI